MEKVILPKPVDISVSVVSHGQMALVRYLMQDIQRYCSGQSIELLLTLNVKEDLQLNAADFSYPVIIIRNSVPQGFGANHNQAFKRAIGAYFCIVNPDVRLTLCPLLALMVGLKDPNCGVVAPRVLNPDGRVEDSARRFPTPSKIVRKLLMKYATVEYVFQNHPVPVDWVGGMFMMFRCDVFDRLKGFDERYFLYYEDVDICSRLNLLGLTVLVCPEIQVVHHAQRSSHHSIKFLRWHVSSMLRYFMSPVYLQLKRLRRV